jgi:PAS domain S-box-containing protein
MRKMYKGGSSYTARTASIIRYAGLFVPIVLIAYGWLIEFGIITPTRLLSIPSFTVLSLWWLYISIIQFVRPSKTKVDSGLRLLTYHLLAGAYLVFVAGIESPLVGCWILLMIASNTYFSKRGIQLSVLGFAVVIAADIGLWWQNGNDLVMYDLVALVAVLITGFITVSLTKSQGVTKVALDRSKAQEALQRDRVLTIVNNLTVGVLSTDSAGIIRVYNAASLNLIDTNDSLNGQHIDDILTVVDQDDKKVSLFNELKAVKSVVKRDDLNYTFSDGEEIRLELTYSPIRSSYSRSKKAESYDGYIIIMRDVTKAKSLEEERDEFISVVSHELRTPLTIAEGSLSNVQVMMGHPDITQKMLKDSVDLAHEQLIFLAHMVNDLSTLSRAERGVADNPELIDIRELMHKLYDEYNKDASAKKLHLNLDLGATLGSVSTSRLYLEELLQNFVTNAIKYTKTGTITVSAKQKVGNITLAVKDTGIGISKSDQTKIFNKFYRSEDYRTRETSGTGLGLYVAHKLAHKLGTKITMVSRLNHGSTFSITLPETTKKTPAVPIEVK